MKLTINGETHDVDADPEMPLLWVLRDHLGLTGTKFGCGVAQCGACTVHLNGEPIRACSTPVGGLANVDITTIEGLRGPQADALRAAWAELDVPQCGYCQSGQLMSAERLLRQSPRPTASDIDDGMSGNLCRCATYVRIRRAIGLAAERLEEKA
ncbi:MAG: (2Fe-2S)-binding protein [Myxococcota bacterium]